MTDEEKRALSLVRFKRAEECLNTAEENVKLGDYRAAANRTYYAISMACGLFWRWMKSI